MKKGLILLFATVALVACGNRERAVEKKVETKQVTKNSEKKSGMDLEAIKKGDFSSIKGTWIDGRGNELEFSDKGLISEKVELDKASLKIKNGHAELSVHAKSGVGGYGLLLAPKGQKIGPDDASDKSKDRLWTGQSASYSDADQFYYRKNEQLSDRKVEASSEEESRSSSSVKKWASDRTTASSSKADQDLYPGYTAEQIEAARAWALMIGRVPSEFYISDVSPAGTKIYQGGLGVAFPKPVRHLGGGYMAEGTLTYASNGDGTVTFYPVPSHWQQSPDQLNSPEYMEEFTQNILDHQKTVELPAGDPEMIRQILAVLRS